MLASVSGGALVMGTWEILEHTADVGLKIRAESWADILETAARGTVALLLHRPPKKASERQQIIIDEDGLEDTFVAWLQELLYIFETQDRVPVDFNFTSAEEEHVEADVGFARFSEKRHQPHMQIKAVTYHELFVRHDGDRWQAQVLFDI